jgi:hypothetical protein
MISRRPLLEDGVVASTLYAIAAGLLARAVNARRCKHPVGRSSQAPDPPVDA